MSKFKDKDFIVPDGTIRIGEEYSAAGYPISVSGSNTSLFIRDGSSQWTTPVTFCNFDTTSGNGTQLQFLTHDLSGDPDNAARVGCHFTERSATGVTGELFFEVADDANNPSEVVRINKLGYLGIGTPDPKNDLHIHSSANSVIYLGNDNIAHPFGSWPSTVFGHIGPASTTNGGLYFEGISDTDAEGLYISAIMGANDPTDTKAAIQFRARKNNSGAIQAIGNDETMFGVNNNGGTNLFVIKGGGNVGIGTTSPSTTLHVERAGINIFTGTASGVMVVSHSTNTADYYSNIDFRSPSYGTDTPKARIGAKMTATGSNLYFGTSNNYETGITNEAMVIDESGRLSVGTTDYETLVTSDDDIPNKKYVDDLYEDVSASGIRQPDTGNLFVGAGAGDSQSTGDYNVALGQNSGYYNDGTNNVAVGYEAGYGDSGGSAYDDCVAIGYQAGYNLDDVGVDCSNQVLIGTQAGYNLAHPGGEGVCSNNVAIGYKALYTAGPVQRNIAIGSQAGYSQSTNNGIYIGHQAYYYGTGGYNVLIGTLAGYGSSGATTGGNNVGVGSEVLYELTSGTANIAIGQQAGYSVTSNDYNAFIGYAAGKYAEGSDNICIGYLSGQGADGSSTYTNNVLIGTNTGWLLTSGGNNVCVGYKAGDSVNTGDYNILIGSNAGTGVTSGSYHVLIGEGAGENLSSQNNAVYIGYQAGQWGVQTTPGVAVGYQAGKGSSTGGGWTTSVIIGYQAGNSIQNTSNSVIIGHHAVYGAGLSGANTVAIGSQSGYSLTTGTRNISLGSNSMMWNTTGSYNIAIGFQSCGYGNATMTAQGDSNACIGDNSGYYLSTGNRNIALGHSSLYYNETGNNNICIGYTAGVGASNQNHSDNILIGYQSGHDITTGSRNIFIGTDAGYENTTGQYSIFIGYQAGQEHVAADYNVCIGYFAGRGASGLSNYDYNTIVGNYAGQDVRTASGENVFLGHGAAQYNREGTSNVCVGYHAGRSTTSGSYNNGTFVGYQAGYSITTGASNVALGYQAGNSLTDGTYNVFLGTQAGFSEDGGDRNTAIGFQALYTQDGADHNTVIGNVAGFAVTTGGSNTVVGSSAMRYNQTGGSNTIVGYAAGYGSSGNSYLQNTFVGCTAGYSVTTGDENVFMGYRAGYLVDAGGSNTCIGYKAGDTITTGGNNTCVGFEADVGGAASSNRMALGNGAACNDDNTVVIGNTSVSGIGGYADWSNYSDERLKENIENNPIGLDFIEKLAPRKFLKKYQEDVGPQDGLIAQEVKQAMDELGISFSGWSPGGDGYQTLRYATFVVPLINAVKELKGELDELKKEIRELKGGN